jgi:diguanylate cyclase (GGDEF)-like protein
VGTQRDKSAARAKPGPLLAAAAGFAVMWCGILGLSVAFENRLFVALGAGGLILTAIAIGALDRHQIALRRLAETDPLTGLDNHGGFHLALRKAIAAGRSEGTQVSLVHLDLDDFKLLNDSHGHPYGDEVLRGVGVKLREAVRDSDTAARVGGEEFALVLPGTSPEAAVEIADRVRSALGQIELIEGTLSSSAGIATYPDDAADQTTLCELADEALYAAKREGKRRTRQFDPHRVPRNYKGARREELLELIEKPGSLRTVFQPVASLATGQVSGFEALTRIDLEPKRPIGTVFAEAKGCGLGPMLEAAAIKAALQPLGQPPGTHLAVNVSYTALPSDEVQSVLPQDLTDIVIEITEHEDISDDNAALRDALQQVRERGALIALDDAGAGYSGLQQLARLKPDIVKLDRSLVNGVNGDPARLALIESFVRYSNRMGAIVCAEGIESLDELAALADLDVQWGQGNVLGTPSSDWCATSPEAASVCRNGLEAALSAKTDARRPLLVAGDRGLETIGAALAGARSRQDLSDALNVISMELQAGVISLSQWDPLDGTLETLAGSSELDWPTSFAASDYPLTERALREQRAFQVLVSDPRSDPREVELMLELGCRSLLMVPVVRRGETMGLLEAYSGAERPWTRLEINRARIIANQFAATLGPLPSERIDSSEDWA